jgi:archaellum component FlaF (FlaF/FlaG flagellin family)
MDSSIPAMVIGAILLLGASLLSRSSITNYDLLGQQIKQVEARAGEQARTQLTITSASLDGAQDTLTLQLRNDGQTRVATWSAVDVIVSYFTAPTTRVTDWMAFTSGAPGGGEWTVTSISPDTFEPGILNPGETATLTVVLSPPAATGHTHQVLVTAENGVTASALFSN